MSDDFLGLQAMAKSMTDPYIASSTSPAVVAAFATRTLDLLAELRKRDDALVSTDKDIDGELQDAEPSNYEEDNFDAGYIHGLTYAQVALRAAIAATTGGDDAHD